MKEILIINGSLGGSNGNTGKLVDIAAEILSKSCKVHVACVGKTGMNRASLLLTLDKVDGLMFATGTYWDSWGSPLQELLEETTDLEGTSSWLGKPAGIIVTEHSCGGKAVLSRLQGVLSSIGLLIPPMSGLVYSMATQLALQTPGSLHQGDLWQLDDIKIICHNLVEAVNKTNDWKAWDVDRNISQMVWLKP